MREQLYVLINPRNYEPVVICKVILTRRNKELAFFKITEVIYDDSGNGFYRYIQKIGEEVCGSLQYIYDIK